MDFYDVLERMLILLQRHQRVSYRALKRQFDLDDAYLDDLTFEISKVQQLAVDQDDEILVWTGVPATPEVETRCEAEAKARLYTLLPAVMWVLQRERRITYRELQHIFSIDDTLMAEIREELTFRQLAIEEDGKELVWIGETPPNSQPRAVAPSQQNTAADESNSGGDAGGPTTRTTTPLADACPSAR